MPERAMTTATASAYATSARDASGQATERWSISPVRYYVVDSGSTPRVIRVYDVMGGSGLANGRLFVDMSPGTSDGIRCDVDGNLWAAAGSGGEGFDGVHIFAPDGDRIGQILLPEKCANICFGGAKRNRLFMAASQSIYAVYVETQGVQMW